MKFTLRPYQNDTVEAIMAYINEPYKHTKGIVRAGVAVNPTGTGKSLIVAEIANRIDAPVLCLQPSKELLSQNYKKYLYYNDNASVYSASLNRREIGEVTYATPKSILKEVQAFRELGVYIVVIDECHLATKKNGEIGRFLEAISRHMPIIVIGLTASPLELRVNDMMGAHTQIITRSRANLFRDIIHIVQVPDICEKYWTPLRYIPHEVETHKLQLNKQGSEYTEISMTEHYEHNDLENRIVREIKALKFDGVKSVLVFVPTIEQANRLHQRIKDSVVVHSKMTTKQRERALEAFVSRMIMVAITVNALGTGFDDPDLEYILMARPTNSYVTYYQQGGRVCRPGQKPFGGIIDMSGNFERFGYLEKMRFAKVKGRWEMFNDKKRLTNVAQQKPLPEELRGLQLKDMVLEKIWFGNTHKDKTVKQLPLHYIKWLLDNFTFRDERSRRLELQCKLELHERAKRASR